MALEDNIHITIHNAREWLRAGIIDEDPASGGLVEVCVEALANFDALIDEGDLVGACKVVGDLHDKWNPDMKHTAPEVLKLRQLVGVVGKTINYRFLIGEIEGINTRGMFVRWGNADEADLMTWGNIMLEDSTVRLLLSGKPYPRDCSIVETVFRHHRGFPDSHLCVKRYVVPNHVAGRLMYAGDPYTKIIRPFDKPDYFRGYPFDYNGEKIRDNWPL